MTVKLVMLTVEPAVIDTVFMLRSAPEVPTSPSATSSAPVPVARIRKYPAVPLESADESSVIVSAVMTPPGLPSAADPKAGSANVQVASRVPDAAVSGSAGCAPERISIAAAVLPLLTSSSKASARRRAVALEMRKLRAVTSLFRYHARCMGGRTP